MPERLLDALLGVIDAAHDDFDQPATLYFAAADPTADPDGITIGQKQIDGHPLDHLLGFVAPDDWTVLGLVVCGWMGPRDDARTRPSQHPDRRRIRQAFLVGRSGATASVVHFQDGADPLTEPPTVGTILDALLRCFGLPTAPPDEPTSELFTRWWLAAVAGEGQLSAKRLTWRHVTGLHPGVEMLRLGGDRVRDGDVVRVARAMANVLRWPFLRELAIEGRLPGRIDPTVAAWMDDGMFSRWLLGEYPPVDVLLDALADHVTPSTRRRLTHAVAELADGASHAA